MNERRQDIRLTSRELFVFYNKKLGLENSVGGCSNKRILEERTGVGWSVLEREFTRLGHCYFDNGEVVILKLFTADIKKGNQSVSRKGRGGMEQFAKYVLGKKSEEYY
jgi:hypothetical protein